MKNIRTLLSSAAFGLVALSTSFAATSLDRPANLPGPYSIAPIPVKVVHFVNLPLEYRDVSVRVEFTLDPSGKGHQFVGLDHMSDDLANRLLPLLAQWEFTPCRDAKGNAVERKVILPLTLTD